MEAGRSVKRSFFDDASSPKRRKLQLPDDLDQENSDELSSEIATLPLEAMLPLNSSYNPMRLSNITQSNFSTQSKSLLPSSPPDSFNNQPTQIPGDGSDESRAPVVQVQASSPLGPVGSSIIKTQSRKLVQQDGIIKPFDFYHSNANGMVVALDSDGPQYIGSSSEGDGSDDDIKPTFGSSIKPFPSIRDRREGSLTSQKSKIDRIIESPVLKMKSHAAQYTYTGGRLDSLKGSSYPSSTGGGFRAQHRPEPAIPITISPLEVPIWMKEKVDRMKNVLPNKSTYVLVAALNENEHDYDKAMEYLTGLEENTIDLTGSDDDKKHSIMKTLNRGAGAGRVAIKDKWGTAQAKASPIQSSPPPIPEQARKRLVRGSNRPDGPTLPRTPQHNTIIVEDSDSDAEIDGDDSEDERELETRILKYINSCTNRELADIACTTKEIAQIVLSRRPFKSLDEVREVREAPIDKIKKRGGRTRAIGEKLVDVCTETWRGYEAVDSLIQKVEQLGKPIADAIKKWGVDIVSGSSVGELEMTEISLESDSGSAKDSGIGTPNYGSDPVHSDDADMDIKGSKRLKKEFFKDQPSNMREGVVLKDYQIAGINWLNLLYEKKLSCILADEMGLGKTCQVVAFLAHLLTKGIKGPHLIVVPSSTLENWLREFANFCPELKVEPYYGSQKERPFIRAALQKDRSWNVLVTTYQLATGDKNDRGFLKNLKFNCCVYDEGHMLKNSASNRYDALIRLPAEYRLLLTGTPLQNNLQELASLLAFILPNVFQEKKDDLQSIFKYKAKTTDDDESNNALLSKQRISRARAMMTPFVLRRKKQQVLKHLPAKTQRVEYCEMNELQSQIYREKITSAEDAIEARAAGRKATKTTTNLMMQLRKAAIHPLLFRTLYTDELIGKMSKEIMKEEAHRNGDLKCIYEDMDNMNDLELNRLCNKFPRTMGKYSLRPQHWMDAGKIKALKKLLMAMKNNGDRVLIFSQFTQMMDILELVLTALDLDFLRIDGSTAVESRQDLIDKFHDEEDIMVFLLSTKAGGFGINLACANKVIIFDSSFNPHDDAQASDRAHRVGQTREVEVIRFVTKNTIEEQILALANTKLALDQSISEGDDKIIQGKAEQMVAKMLLQANSKQ